MAWEQVTNPYDNIFLSALVAAIPIIFLFTALAIFKLKGHIVGIIILIITLIISVVAFKMPLEYSFFSILYGALFGLWPIGWIVLTAVFLYNLTVKSGYFQIIKDFIAGITNDRRIQAILIAFSFGAFIEGVAGFGAPVVITAAMLAGLGFKPLYAAGLCLIANTAPVAFGAVGIPVITAGAVGGIDAHIISQAVSRQLFILSAFVPFWLVFIMSGWKGAKEVMPAILVSGLSYSLAQILSAQFLGPMLPAIISALVSMVSLVILLKFWKPKSLWRFENESEADIIKNKHSFKTVLKAWSPYIILTIIISDWSIKPVKNILDLTSFKIVLEPINQMILISGKPLEAVFNFNWLSATGTSILITSIISAFILGISYKEFAKIFIETLINLKSALLTIACFLGFAYAANWSGMTTSLGMVLSLTGTVFPFISPFIGWLGVMITGSDTSSNALFCNMQRVTAESMDINPVLTVATNSSGGCAGKMISPQSLVIGASSTGLTGKEGDLFRFTILHSLFFVTIIGIITFVQAYFLQWTIPTLKTSITTSNYNNTNGLLILAISFIAIIILGFIVYEPQKSLNQNK